MSQSPTIAVIPGGSAGVGRATLREFASGTTWRSWRREDGLAVAVDVSDADAVEAAADRVENELGPVAVWVNVAFAWSLAWFLARFGWRDRGR